MCRSALPSRNAVNGSSATRFRVAATFLATVRRPGKPGPYGVIRVTFSHRMQTTVTEGDEPATRIDTPQVPARGGQITPRPQARCQGAS